MTRGAALLQSHCLFTAGASRSCRSIPPWRRYGISSPAGFLTTTGPRSPRCSATVSQAHLGHYGHNSARQSDVGMITPGSGTEPAYVRPANTDPAPGVPLYDTVGVVGQRQRSVNFPDPQERRGWSVQIRCRRRPLSRRARPEWPRCPAGRSDQRTIRMRRHHMLAVALMKKAGAAACNGIGHRWRW